MAKKSENVILDEHGISVGSELSDNRTIEKVFLLSRNTDWPTDTEGKPVELRFRAIIDLNGINFKEILEDAIRSKVITLQNALRGYGKKRLSFEVLQAMTKEPLQRHYSNCDAAPTNPVQAVADVQHAFSRLAPAQQREFRSLLTGINQFGLYEHYWDAASAKAAMDDVKNAYSCLTAKQQDEFRKLIVKIIK